MFCSDMVQEVFLFWNVSLITKLGSSGGIGTFSTTIHPLLQLNKTVSYMNVKALPLEETTHIEPITIAGRSWSYSLG